MDTSDSHDWSMLVVATEVITALDLRGWRGRLDPRSTDALAEIAFADHLWSFAIGRCGWSTYLVQPEPGDSLLSAAVPGHVDALDLDTPPSVVAHEIIRQLVEDSPLPGAASARIDRPRRRPGTSHAQACSAAQLHASNHPAGRRLRVVDTGTEAQIVHLRRGGDRD